MTRILIIVLNLITTWTNAQDSLTVVHKYSICNEFVDLQIKNKETVEIYILPNQNFFFSGQCIRTGDTLTFNLKAKDDFILEKYSDTHYKEILETVSKFIIVGDILIPAILVNNIDAFESTYSYNDKLITNELTFNISDSTFQYKKHGRLAREFVYGKWKKNEQIIKLEFDKRFHWYDDSELILCKNYTIRVRDDEGVRKYWYFEKK